TGSGSSGDQERKIFVIVKAWITHAASIQVDRVIEKRAVPVGSGFHSLEEVRKERNMERIDLCNLRYFFGIVAVMTDWMVRVRNADLRIRSIALLARELEGDD